MRISKLLVLSVLGLFGLNANAADLVERTAPEKPAEAAALDAASFESLDKTPAPLAIDQAYVMYNVAAQKCYLAGNNYNTRASIGPWTSTDGDTNEYAAAVMYFTQTGEAKAKGDDVYELKSWVPKFSEFRSSFGGNTGVGDIWTDNNGRDDRFWKFADQGNNTYRISNQKNSTTFFLGWNGSDSDWTLYLLDPAAEGVGIDWQFFTVADWNNYLIAKAAYDAAPALKSLIELAETGGVDVSAAVAVYNNLQATASDINAAIDALNEAMNSGIASGTAENPSIATSAIKNPNFDNASNADWKGTAPNMTGSGSHGPANAAEHYNKTFNTYQDIENLPNGVYLLGVNSFFRGSWDDYMEGTNLDAYPALYAKVGEDSTSVRFNNAWSAMNTKPMAGKTDFGTTSGEGSQSYEGATYYIPNDPSAFRQYEEEGFYKTAVVVEVTDGKMRIGVAKNAKSKDKEGKESTTDWAIFDTFSLMYYGNTPASFQAAFKGYMDAKYTLVINSAVTESYIVAYNEAVAAAVAAKTVSSQAEAVAAMAEAQPAIAAAAENVYKNARLWAQWEALLNDALTYKGEGNDELDEYVEYDAPEIKEAMALTNEELATDIAKLQEWIEQANMKVEPGTDVTKMYLKNADCESTDGWQGGPVKGSGGGNSCFEKYGQSSFDVYQVVTKAPKGVYSIEVQGFYRRMRPESGSYTLYTNGEQTPCGYVYMNNNQSPLKCVYDDPSETKYSQGNDPQTKDDVELYYPNDMTSAAEAFAAEKYKSKAYGLVLNAGDELRIGVKGNEGGSDWAIWDNFKLVYEGYTADVVKPVLVEEIAAAEKKVTETMGKDVKDALNAAIADAKTAAAGTDGEAMFNALAALSAINPDASIEKFKTLISRNEELADATASAECAVSTIQEAQTLNTQITTGIADGIYTDADVDDLLAQIATMIKKLQIPDGLDQATDQDPKNATTIITNYNYDKGNNDGWTLTDGVTPGFNSGLIEVYNTNFDEYQDLEGLPEGTYEVSVQGFYRFGNGVRDDSTYVQAPTENNNLKLYVTVGENTIHVPMPRLAKDGKEEHTSYQQTDDGKDFVAGDDLDKDVQWQWMWLGEPVADADSTSATGYRLANGMVPVSILFEAGKFTGTSIIFKVGAEGKARIGLKKEVQEAENWCIWDNWQLTYFGPNSAKEATVDGIVSTTAAVAAKVEFFGLNGARISKPTKGVAIMKQTLSDGTVKTTKVIIK
jgi:hypothetical protein